MFSLIAGFWHYFFTSPQLQVLVIGLDYAGKTTLLEKLKSQFGNMPSIPPDRIPPTIGMNLARLTFKGSKLLIWDVSGQIKMRMLWEKYYEDAHCILFLVDAHDRQRLDEAKLAFEAVCDNEAARGVPVLVLANKQDLPGAMTAGELATYFYSTQDANDRTRIIPISALRGDGLELAMNTLLTEARRTRTQSTVSRNRY